MLKTQKGSTDGFTVKEFCKGVEYDLPEALAKTFIDISAAEDITMETVAIGDILETPEKLKRKYKRRKK